MFTILLLGPLSFIDNSPPPNVPSPNFFQTEKMAQNQCFHRNRVVKKNWQWGLGQHGLWHLPDIFSIAPRSLREGHTYSFFLQAVQGELGSRIIAIAMFYCGLVSRLRGKINSAKTVART